MDWVSLTSPFPFILMRLNTCIKEGVTFIFLFESFTQLCSEGVTLRWGEAFLHEMDLTVRRGSSLYP